MPLPFCLTLVAGVASDRGGGGAGAGSSSSRRPRSPSSNKWVSAELVRPLEERYPGIPELAAGQPLPAGLAGCPYVVILGGGHSDMPGAAATSKLSTRPAASPRARGS